MGATNVTCLFRVLTRIDDSTITRYRAKKALALSQPLLHSGKLNEEIAVFDALQLCRIERLLHDMSSVRRRLSVTDLSLIHI